ncbi:MAG: hypothetical protein LBR38_05265 [Synergistaceae bacterium]|nr:hypothetical protein [Synergistaceae bacterium]
MEADGGTDFQFKALMLMAAQAVRHSSSVDAAYETLMIMSGDVGERYVAVEGRAEREEAPGGA